MPIPVQKVVNAQRDFSAGQIDVALKRDDTSPIMKAGLRQCENFRILNSKNVKHRPGRAAKYLTSSLGRVDQVRLSTTVLVDLIFGGDGSLLLRDAAGAVLASEPAGTYPWRTATIQQITWTLVNLDAGDRDIVICFEGGTMIPQVVRYKAGVSFSFFQFPFEQAANGKVLMPFYKLAPSGIALTPSATAGVVTLTTSADYFVPGMVGTHIRWLGSQVAITGYTDARHATGSTEEPLPKTVAVTAVSGDVEGFFSPGDIVEGSRSGLQGEVVSWAAASPLVVNMLKSGPTFTSGTINGADKITGPTGYLTADPAGVNPLVVTVVSPQPSLQWDELVIGNFRGWPQSCFFDQGRLGFTNLPAIPRGIIWTGFNSFYDLSVGANPTDAMFELMSDTAQILHVVPGDGGEVVFTDIGVYYIPVNETNPLKPGSVVFKPISPEPACDVHPLRIAEGTVYVNAGRNRVILIVGTGATYSVKPFGVRDLTANHTDLFSGIKCLAATMGDGTFPERYIYTLDASGGINVGRLELTSDSIGWTPWSGAGAVNWLSSMQSTVLFATQYAVAGAATVSMVEQLDDTLFLDGAIFVNSPPGAMAAPPARGPFWWLANGSVRVMDLGTRDLGIYQVDPVGYLVPQFTGGENLASPQLVAGQIWTATIEPFVPSQQPGSDFLQRMRMRRVAKASIYVQQSNGFSFGARRVPPYRQGVDNPELAPPLREEAFSFRSTGREYDPRIPLIKDTPGPLVVLEIAMEVTA